MGRKKIWIALDNKTAPPRVNVEIEGAAPPQQEEPSSDIWQEIRLMLNKELKKKG